MSKLLLKKKKKKEGGVEEGLYDYKVDDYDAGVTAMLWTQASLRSKPFLAHKKLSAVTVIGFLANLAGAKINTSQSVTRFATSSNVYHDNPK